MKGGGKDNFIQSFIPGA